MAKTQTAAVAESPAVDVDYVAIVAGWSPEERAEREKKFLRKIDFRLLPILVSATTQLTLRESSPEAA